MFETCHLSVSFYLQSAFRHEDLLSPYLNFICCAEISAVLINYHEGIKGIKVTSVELAISQYADGISIILVGTRKYLEICLKILKPCVSGLYVNIDKTRVIWIGSEKNSNIRFCEDYNFH